ncbi:ATP-binding domain-containing protein [Yersinia ruckeri]|uniref:DEAD/DEAH box helicase n=2 Tax=Yersinia ruckeri TaxID=29486 RepID=UPI0005368A52|nr:ATP-binding domain-containing protein [Yersinia ruckeri]AUQ41085.1 RNA helicase [Yersinia ruckeri]EKN4182976.1 DEAD/DEAH box helicase [Yersinia ruckeri]EKN4197363.1 DEAD/DEAH box helicase [Yersinia ruckeri]EKN4204536.1 DEAD/DEAH box helicase [Yersinia ruckeri]EKN4702172.1 DEAD/DEAH box helicase [Yersinia ruckeri]
MIDFVFGKKDNPQAVENLVDCLSKLSLDGTLYIGYPIFDVDDESILTDALLVTKEHGVVAFDLSTSDENELEEIINYQDDIYRGLLKRFLNEKTLLTRRKLNFDINIFSFRLQEEENFDEISIIHPAIFNDEICSLASISDEQFKLINAAIQKTSVLKPQKKRVNVKSDNSYGAIIKQIEKEIANLDRWQKKAAIESPEKPQRIRGLAGCGKTIILAMKAAYLHAYNPTLRIAVTFQSRALYQQFNKLIEKFYFQHTNDEPDYNFLKIRHAWGSNKEVGIYSEICNQLGIEPLSFYAAQHKFGYENAFEGACEEALKLAEKIDVEPLFDYILIDEAQDFPSAFFKLVYKFSGDKKRVIWAYDELQNLGDFTMLPPEKLFGKTSLGTPEVTLVNEQNKPQQDIMLPICYRNPPWTLSLALALGLGIYREDGLIKMFHEPSFWRNIGYEVVGGRLELSELVNLQRSSDRTPDYFNRLLTPADSIKFEEFSSPQSQAEWVANDILVNITQNELEPTDILVIFPDAYTLGSASAYLMNELRKLGINCHVAGKNTSRDVIFLDDSIAITHIHRAKGNEAPMVYAMNSNYSNSGLELGKKRNALFTAITRTKAWLRITGIGDGMTQLSKEITKVFEKNFRLEFQYPSTAELEKLDSAYQDKTDNEKQEIYEGFGQLKKLKAMFDSGELSIEDIPDDLKDFFE